MDNKEKHEEKEDSIEKTKEKYLKYKEKYFLPEFSELNKEFGIERAETDTELFLREIIKGIADKFQNYMRLVEGLINPSNASMFTFSIIKIIDNGKKTKLSEIYKKISEFEIKLIKLDLESSEETEAEFIKESYQTWKEIKKDLYEIIDSVEKNWETKHEEIRKNYFG
jgi:hypothetical protein